MFNQFIYQPDAPPGKLDYYFLRGSSPSNSPDVNNDDHVSKKHKTLDLTSDSENTSNVTSTQPSSSSSNTITTERGSEGEFPLDAKQKAVVHFAKQGKNLFVTGAAGTGKTTLIKRLVQDLDNVHVCSSTGITAIAIGGITLYSYFWLRVGCDLGNGNAKGLAMGRKAYSPLVKKLRGVRILIIEEVSMVSGQLLDYIDNFLQGIRKNTDPFGGIQVLLFGDMGQLQAFTRDKSIRITQAFEADCWNYFNMIKLTITHRQSDDDQYAGLLGRIRNGSFTSADIALLRTRINFTFPNDGIQPTILYGTNREVNTYNKLQLAKLHDADGCKYNAQIIIKSKDSNHSLSKQERESITKKMNDQLLVSQESQLKVGAVVMLLYNMELPRYGNGSTGVIVDFSGKREPIVKFIDGGIRTIEHHTWEFDNQNNGEKWTGTYTQIPLMLAWAITIHKSQGMTLDRIIVALGTQDVFAHHMVYVALSRLKTINGLSLRRLNESVITIDERVKKYL